ncbi:MAG: hypothetical protein ABF289_06520 [Clostridiales bacterium]
MLYDIEKVLKEMNLLYQNFYKWLFDMYDSDTGGFYYSKSAKDSIEFSTDIESTGQGLNILWRSSLITNMPISIKNGFINFFQSRQSTKTGYFYDHQNNMKNFDRMVARAFSYSIHSLDMFGAVPLHPLPGSYGTNNLPNYFQNTDKLLNWMEDRDWNNSWMACDNISAASFYINELTKEVKDKYVSTILSFLSSKQDSEGMWGKGTPYIKISGAFKLCILYSRLNVPMPNVDKIYKYILYTIANDKTSHMCFTRNTVDLLNVIKSYLPNLDENDLYLIINTTYSNLKKFLKTDGGFSRFIKNSPKMPNNVLLGKGLSEGDMNSATQALKIRSLCNSILNKQDKPLKNFSNDFIMLLNDKKNYQ